MQARKSLPGPKNSTAECVRRLLVDGEIIRRKSRLGCEHLVAVNENAPVAARYEFAFV